MPVRPTVRFTALFTLTALASTSLAGLRKRFRQ
ncbi:hypothetical protein STENM327S_09475 [Streptomyces tendae]